MAKLIIDQYKAQEDSSQRKRILAGKEIPYDYGDYGDKMKPGGELHDRLVKFGLEIAEKGLSATYAYHEQWQAADWKATGFVTPEQADPRKNVKDTLRTIVHPMQFQMEEMFCAAAHAVFIQDPIFKWKPFPGLDSLINAAVAEYMVQRHALWFNLGLHMGSLFRDSFRYGVGIGGLAWRVERRRKPVDRQITDDVIRIAKQSGINIPKNMQGRIIREMEEQVVCEGTELQPWDPYNSFYDPSVTPNTFERAAYKGTILTVESNVLLENERNMPGRWFNGQYAKELAQKSYGMSRFNRKSLSGRNDRQSTTFAVGGQQTDHYAFLDVCYSEILIVPSDWGCGDEDYPVRYCLAIAADEIVVAFYPLDLDHGGDNEIIFAPNADGHTFMPVSHILTTSGIQDHVDDIFRCTQASIKKNINGGITIFNHNILDWDDFISNDQPGKVVRPIVPALTKEMMDAALVNIPFIDKTAEHMAYMTELTHIARDGNGTIDIGGPGDLADSERPTKFGMMAQVNSSSSRFKMLAYRMGQQGMTSLGWKMLYNLVQFGEQNMQVDLAGRFAERLSREVGGNVARLNFLADPRDIELNFEMEPYNGAMPQTSDMQGMSEVLKSLMAVPEIQAQIAAEIPIAQVFKAFIRKSGFENLDDYPAPEQVNMQPMPDEQIAQQQQAGNLVPLGPMRGAA